MYACHLGEFHVRGEAFLLVFGHQFGVEVVVEVARNHIGIGRRRAPNCSAQTAGAAASRDEFVP